MTIRELVHSCIQMLTDSITTVQLETQSNPVRIRDTDRSLLRSHPGT
jgi:hypothetical protein